MGAGPIIIGVGFGVSVATMIMTLWSLSDYNNGKIEEGTMKNTVLVCFIVAFIAILVFLYGCTLLSF